MRRTLEVKAGALTIKASIKSNKKLTRGEQNYVMETLGSSLMRVAAEDIRYGLGAPLPCQKVKGL